jgi:hypothetical protein
LPAAVRLPSWVPAGTNPELYGALRGMIITAGVVWSPLFLGIWAGDVGKLVLPGFP